MRFCVLASGSSGNASLLMVEGFGVLLDLGLGPRTLARRLDRVGASWDDIQAVLLTHVHGDHWTEKTFTYLKDRGIPLYCHPSHASALRQESAAFADLVDGACLRFYDTGHLMILAPGVSCRPLRLNHDGGVTCGFRFEAGPDRFGRTSALAYAADLGSWDHGLAEALANVDVLALEFNHDERMAQQSGREEFLIRRVLSDRGHLSNNQAAGLLAEVLARSDRRPLQHLVQLHLSRQCNRPTLALDVARRALHGCLQTIQVHCAEQDRPGAWLSPRRPAGERRQMRERLVTSYRQPLLPGWEG